MQLTPTLIQAKEVVNGGFLRSVPISGSFNFSKLVPHIQDAERRFVLDNSLFNKDFFADLKAKVLNEVSNYNDAAPGGVVEKYGTGDAIHTAYENLWQSHLLDYMAKAVLCEALPFLELQIGNAGVVTLEGNLQRSTGPGGVKFLRDELIRKLDGQAIAIREFICDATASYPLFDPDGDICEDCKDPDDDSAASHLGIVIY